MTRRLRGVAIVCGAAVVSSPAVLMAHRAAAEHVRYYTGLEPATLACPTCHYVGRGGTLGDRLARVRYRSPFAIAVSPDGRKLYVTASSAGSLLVVDAEKRILEREIAVGRTPQGVALSPHGERVYVALKDEDAVAVIDTASGRTLKRLAVGAAPVGVSLTPDGGKIVVAHLESSDIGIYDAALGTELRRLAGGSNPYGVALTPDGRSALLTSQLSFPRRRPEPPVSEVTIVDVASGTVPSRVMVKGAHLLEGIAVAPQGDIALFTLVRPKNLVPIVAVARGWMMTEGIGILDLETGRLAELPLDQPGAFYADPAGVAFTPDGRKAFVSHAGADIVTVVDVELLRQLIATATPAEIEDLADDLGASRRYVMTRIRTGANPKGVACSPDGRFAYVACRLSDRIDIIDASLPVLEASIDLRTSRRETVLRRGERLFNSSGRTFQGQFSCRSCHPEDHVDRLQYDFEPDGLGRNIVDNKTLLGIDGTGPFKWNGKNTSMYMQCGMRFAKFLTRVEPFAPDDLNALVAFMRSLKTQRNRHRPPGGELLPAQARGKALFERTTKKSGQPILEKDRCVTCHPAPLYTSRQKADVGSRSPGDSAGEFDIPQLVSIADSAPYLHDGKALTLEEIWTVYNPEDTHGITSDLGKANLNDLIEYLRTL